MKRWALLITICLILGVVTTVGVAWMFAASQPGVSQLEQSITVRRTSDPAPEVHSIVIWDAFGVIYVESDRRRILAPPDPDTKSANVPAWVSRIIGQPTEAFTNRSLARERRMLFAVGWPRHALWCEASAPDDIQGGFVFSVGRNNMILPTRPIYIGFLINTLFYAAIWFGLFFAMGRTRRFIRTRRGRCPQCGYDIRGEFKDGCSECGWNRGEAVGDQQSP